MQDCLIIHGSNAWETALADSTLIGNKAAGLGWLARAGFEVPPWIALSTAFFQQFKRECDLESLISQLASSPVETSRKIREKIAGSRFSQELEDALVRSLASQFSDWEQLSFSVRSSLTDEDHSSYSFAGQMDSFLFQQGRQEILGSLLRCYESAFSERAIQYRLKHGISVQNIQPAVIVQKMAEGEVSGVLFTAHPALGSREHALISAAFGTCDGVVSGSADCDEFTVSYVDRKIQRTLRNIAPCLSDTQVQEIVSTGEKISLLKGRPQDIEWTWSEGRLVLLQTRPITKLARPAKGIAKHTVFDNSNIQESYNGVTTPLTFSFARNAYFQVYRQVMRITGFSEQETRQHDRRHSQLLGLIHGRVYYNIRNWHEGLLLLPSFGKNKSDMERMMGVTEPVDFVTDQVLSPAKKLRALSQMIPVVARISFMFATLKNRVRVFEERFQCEYDRFDRARFPFVSSPELIEQVIDAKAKFLENWVTPIINDFYVMTMNGRVNRSLKKVGMENEQMNLLAGEELASTAPTKELLSLCDEIRSSLQLQSLFGRLELKKESAQQSLAFLELLARETPSFHQRCLNYIELYGDRCIGELKLESTSLREDPTFLFSVLKSYLRDDKCRLADFTAREMESRNKAEEKVFQAIRAQSGAFALWKFKRDLKRLRAGICQRESMRLARTRVFGLFRSFYLELGKRFEERGVLESQRDVFYLTEDEIDQYFHGTSVQSDLRALTGIRKAEFANYQNQELPNHFSLVMPVNDLDPAAVIASSRKQENTESLLRGIGCYPGVVKTRVKVMTEPDYREDLSGKILCTVRTDPGWAPLFLHIDGLLVERGSTLSHSAVVARELGVPTVVGVPEITRLLQDGDWIEMDGEAGTIQRSLPESELTP